MSSSLIAISTIRSLTFPTTWQDDLRDAVRLERVAGAYRSKYGWEPAPRDGAFYGEGAPTAGPPLLDVYAVAPQVAFGFGTGASLNAMRWSFSP